MSIAIVRDRRAERRAARGAPPGRLGQIAAAVLVHRARRRPRVPVGARQPPRHGRPAGPGIRVAADEDDSRQRRRAAQDGGLSYADVVAARVFLTDDSYLRGDERRVSALLHDRTAGARDRRDGAHGQRLVGRDHADRVNAAASRSSARPCRPVCRCPPPCGPAMCCSSPACSATPPRTRRDLPAQTTRGVRAASAARSKASGCRSVTSWTTSCTSPTSGSSGSVDGISREIFPQEPPARTVVGARLVARAGLVEMMMTAVGR